MTEKELIKELKLLGSAKIVEIFTQLSKDWERDFKYDGEIYEEQKYVICSATRCKDNNEWEQWKLALLCQHDITHYETGWAITDVKDYFQFGCCCGVETASYAKNAVCPLCGGKIYGT